MGDRLGGASTRVASAHASTSPLQEPNNSQAERGASLAHADALSQQIKEEMVEQAVSCVGSS